MQIEVVEPHDVAYVWPLVCRHIEAAQRRGPTDHTLHELRHYCHGQSWRLLVLNNGDGAAIIRLLNGRLHVVSLGGTFDKGWPAELHEWLMAICPYFELKGVTLCGRKGWGRLLAPLGYRPIGGGYLGVECK